MIKITPQNYVTCQWHNAIQDKSAQISAVMSKETKIRGSEIQPGTKVHHMNHLSSALPASPNSILSNYSLKDLS